MTPLVIYMSSVLAALVFEWVFRLHATRYAGQSSKSQWAMFFWTSIFMLCGLSLMSPYDGQTLVAWTPMGLVSFFHVQLSLQRDVIDRLSGKPPNTSASSSTKGT